MQGYLSGPSVQVPMKKGDAEEWKSNGENEIKQDW